MRTPLLLTVALLLGTVCGDDFDTVKQRCLQQFCYPAAAALPSIVSSALSLASKLNATCYWPDINYNQQERANWDTINHLSRATTMAQALTTPGSTVFDNAALSKSYHCALGAYMFHKPAFTNPNWWYAWIGENLQLQVQFLLLGDNRTTAEESAGFVRYSYQSAWWVNSYGGGANLVWMIQAELLRGLATRNMTAVNQSFSRMWADVAIQSAVSNGQGIMADWSYHFHGEQIMSYSYGADWANDVLLFSAAAENTTWQLPTAGVDALGGMLSEGNAQMEWGGDFDWTLAGRGVDRPVTDFGVPFSSASLRGLAARGGPHAPGLIAWADRLDSVPGAAPLSSSRYYWTSDYYTHHRPTWGAVVRMHGNNGAWAVVAGECDNSEDVLGEHSGSGVMNVYGDLTQKTAVSAPYKAIFPLLDWSALGGITVEHNTSLEKCGSTWAVRDTAFVGATSDGLYGAVAMDTATHNLTGHRSWMFFDTSILALATTLVDPTFNNVRTSLVQRLLPNPASDPRGHVIIGLRNGSTASLPDGAARILPSAGLSWIAAGGNGYFPTFTGEGADVIGVSVGTVTQPWDRIGPFPGNATGRLLSIYIDHGNKLTNGSYAYLVAPNVTAAEMSTFVSGVECTSHSVTVHGATVPSARVLNAVFWAAAGGQYACSSPSFAMTVTSDSAAIVIVKQATDGALTVSASHPAKAGAVLHITLDRAVSGAGCAAGVAPGSTTFSIALPASKEMLGSTVSVTCK